MFNIILIKLITALLQLLCIYWILFIVLVVMCLIVDIYKTVWLIIRKLLYIRLIVFNHLRKIYYLSNICLVRDEF